MFPRFLGTRPRTTTKYSTANVRQCRQPVQNNELNVEPARYYLVRVSGRFRDDVGELLRYLRHLYVCKSRPAHDLDHPRFGPLNSSTNIRLNCSHRWTILRPLPPSTSAYTATACDDKQAASPHRLAFTIDVYLRLLQGRRGPQCGRPYQAFTSGTSFLDLGDNPEVPENAFRSTRCCQMLPLDATVVNKRPQNLVYVVRRSGM